MITSDSQARVVHRAQKDPVWWIESYLRSGLWSLQSEIVNSVRDNPKTAVRSCHGPGKSYIAARILLAFLYTYENSLVLSTAPTWRQVEKIIWKEVRIARGNTTAPLGGTMPPKAPEIHIRDGWAAFGLSVAKPDTFQGHHAEHILLIADEAAGIHDDIFESAEGILTSNHARILLLGNPTIASGTFFRSFHGDTGWKTFHIPAWSTPNFTQFGIEEEDLASDAWQEKIGSAPLPYPQLITPAWAADKYVRWGPHSPPYQARVAGNFPDQATNAVIPLAWIEAAMARTDPLTKPLVYQPQTTSELGVDVGRGGDLTVIAARHNNRLAGLETHTTDDLMQSTGHIIMAESTHHTTKIKVDSIGIGAGVVDRLAELNRPVVGINASTRAINHRKFRNKRAEMWWTFRDMLDPNPITNPDPISLIDDDDLLADLAAPTWFPTSQGLIQVESKEDLLKRLHRSPDRGEATILAFATDLTSTEPLAPGQVLKTPTMPHNIRRSR